MYCNPLKSRIMFRSLGESHWRHTRSSSGALSTSIRPDTDRITARSVFEPSIVNVIMIVVSRCRRTEIRLLCCKMNDVHVGSTTLGLWCAIHYGPPDHWHQLQ